ncbi:lipid A biosynthesis lauroyltransferase [Kordia sp. SMS9]|uniref:lysophospholipid acyltransferase family protein n=1 Tax=Kordia sp. SMS9 TaxID=2282170 RepID=UPI000E0D3450|nr:lysophospholipid acyltransferase family protein [Kordia sp. SMS9]AXG71170.1 lipid A biosynthesis lauroyltransferase [Kordia sp. SMS9]
MQLIAFILIYPILWLISILPFRLLYLFSDFCYFIVYRLIGYRKKVVRENLALVFPEKSDAERLKIEKKFYSHLCDMFLEMIKSLTISDASLRKRFVFPNIDLIHEYEKKGQSIILISGHYANWEWMNVMKEYVSFKGYGIYKKLSNKYFDKLVRDIREKRDSTLITTKETFKTIKKDQDNGVLGIYYMVSDQSPKPLAHYYWTDFMNITVPCFDGPEILARKADMPFIYFRIEKVKRGHYQGIFEDLTPKGISNYAKHEPTEFFYRALEKQIREVPEYYYWVHKRWKHRDKVPPATQKS